MIELKTTLDIRYDEHYDNKPNTKWALVEELVTRLEVCYCNNNPSILLNLIKELKR